MEVFSFFAKHKTRANPLAPWAVFMANFTVSGVPTLSQPHTAPAPRYPSPIFSQPHTVPAPHYPSPTPSQPHTSSVNASPWGAALLPEEEGWL